MNSFVSLILLLVVVSIVLCLTYLVVTHTYIQSSLLMICQMRASAGL